MEPIHYKFNSIEQFRHQHKALREFIHFKEMVNDEPTWDYTRELPTVIVNSGFEVKQIMSRVNDRAKKYFLALIKK